MAMLVPEPKLVGSNKKPGRCEYCGSTVPAKSGQLFRGVAGWYVYHHLGQCPK